MLSGTSQERVTVRRRLFDQRVAYLGDPFAWVIAAEPLRPEQVKPELDLLVNEILPLSRGEVGEAKRIALERKQARHRELSRAQVGGAWLIRVLVGGMDRRGAATVAATLCASCELDGLPYVITPAGPAMPLPDAARADLRDQHGDRAPLTAGTELLVALTRPPERQLPGLRLVDPHLRRHPGEHRRYGAVPGGRSWTRRGSRSITSHSTGTRSTGTPSSAAPPAPASHKPFGTC